MHGGLITIPGGGEDFKTFPRNSKKIDSMDAYQAENEARKIHIDKFFQGLRDAHGSLIWKSVSDHYFKRLEMFIEKCRDANVKAIVKGNNAHVDYKKDSFVLKGNPDECYFNDGINIGSTVVIHSVKSDSYPFEKDEDLLTVVILEIKRITLMRGSISVNHKEYKFSRKLRVEGQDLLPRKNKHERILETINAFSSLFSNIFQVLFWLLLLMAAGYYALNMFGYQETETPMKLPPGRHEQITL